MNPGRVLFYYEELELKEGVPDGKTKRIYS